MFLSQRCTNMMIRTYFSPHPFPIPMILNLTFTFFNHSFRMFSNEDVTIGAWMLAMNVNHENNLELCARECTSTSIAVWDIPKCSGWYFSLVHWILSIFLLCASSVSVGWDNCFPHEKQWFICQFESLLSFSERAK